MGLIKGKDKFILNLSASWCGDCHREKLKLDKYYNKLPKNKDVAVVYMNFSKKLQGSNEIDPKKTGNIENAIKYMKEHGFKFPVFFDTNNFLKDNVNPQHVPLNFVIDGKGKIKVRAEEVDMDNLFLDNKES